MRLTLEWQRRFSADDFEKMAELGVFGETERINLVDGVIFNSPTPSPLHCSVVHRLAAEFHQLRRKSAIVSVHNPIRLDEFNEPIPDLALLHYRKDYYSTAHPGAADLFLVVEVVEDTDVLDRGIKLPAYAEAGVPELWLMCFKQASIEMHRRPENGIYTERSIRFLDWTVSPQAFPDLVIPVASILSRSE